MIELKQMNIKKPNKCSQRFLDTCPRKLDHYPKRICKWGRAKILELGDQSVDDPICPYYINNPAYKFCFWIYLSEKANCREHTFREIAELTGTSINNIKLAETSGLKRLAKNIKHSILRSMLNKGKLEVD